MPGLAPGKAAGTIRPALRAVWSPTVLIRTYRDPVALSNLAVDLLPVVAVLAFGWGAAPLVALYWLENLIIGVFSLLRMMAAGAAKGAAGLAGAVLLGLFFTVHYGAFCFGHGVFLYTIAGNAAFPGPAELLGWAATSGAHMGWFLAAIMGVNLALFSRDYIGQGEFRRADNHAEMAAPYGRIVTLHLAIILGAALALGMDEPLLGVLLLILLRVAFGVLIVVARRLRRDAYVMAAASVVDDDA